ncbi:MAG: ADP-ribosylation factor-like protein [Promethearchaeota archaeon]
MSTVAKIIFAGLDGAGKTSFLNTLEGQYSTLMHIKPTLGADRRSFNVFGFKIQHWDLGGQKSYRELYLREKDRFFSDVSSLFFVVDIQDRNRDDEVIDYFGQILEILRELEETPTINICFHKFDADIQSKEEYIEHYNKLSKIFKNMVADFQLHLFKTTIFEDWTLLKAFSQGILSTSPKTTMIESQLKNFARHTFSSGVILLDSNHLILGSTTSNPELQEIAEAIVGQTAKIHAKLIEYEIDTQNIILTLKPGKYYQNLFGKEMVALYIPIKAGEMDLSVLSLTKNPKTMKLMVKFSTKLAKNIADLIRSFYE